MNQETTAARRQRSRFSTRFVAQAGLAAWLALGCASTAGPPPKERVETGLSAREEDLILRLVEALQHSKSEAPDRLMNGLEQLLPAWQSEQRKGRADVLEVVLTSRVIPHYDIVSEMFLSGPHERRLVAAWALGFTRVPLNDLGIATRHKQALELLLQEIPKLPDDVLANALIAIWILADPSTPLATLTDLIVNHHDALVRANATLALGRVLTEDRALSAVEPVLVALDDVDPTVRVHAASVAHNFPDRAYLARLETLIVTENTPLAQARMASALGALGSRSSSRVLIPLLTGDSELVSVYARTALSEIFGVDQGANPSAWIELVRATASDK